MRKQTILWGCAALLILASGAWAQESQDKQPFIGVLLDGTPLPELLTKHLGLAPEQGLRIMNISVDSAADKAGLERDDIIIAFQGQNVTDLDRFIDRIKEAGVGATVSLQVIHLGRRKTVELTLEPLDKMEWKYPPEPEVVETWRPGNIFKLGPDGQQWLQIPRDKLHEFNLDIDNIFKEKYTYGYTADDGEFTVTIEGRPTDKDTRVVVRVGQKEYATTVGEIDSLPDKYRASAKQAIESAKKDFQITPKFRLPEPPGLDPDMYQKYFRALPDLDMDRLYEQKDRALERLQQEMGRLQERVQRLEKDTREMRDKLLNREDRAEPQTDQTEQPAAGRLQGGEST